MIIQNSEQFYYCDETDDMYHCFYIVQKYMNFGNIWQNGGTILVKYTSEELTLWKIVSSCLVLVVMTISR